MGEVNLHDYGEWDSFNLHPGDQVIGLYGLKNNLIRGLGFVLFNMNPPKLTELDMNDPVASSSTSSTVLPKLRPRNSPRSPGSFGMKRVC